MKEMTMTMSVGLWFLGWIVLLGVRISHAITKPQFINDFWEKQQMQF